LDADLLPARARRHVPLAPRRRRRGLALVSRRAAGADPVARWARDGGPPPRRGPCGGRAAAMRGAGGLVADGDEPRRLHTRRLHGRAGLHLRRLRDGAARLAAGPALMARGRYRPSTSPGSHVVSGGQKVAASSTATSGSIHGTMARDIASKRMWAMRAVTKRTTPTGGVIVPIMRLSTKMSPNCTGSMPN